MYKYSYTWTSPDGKTHNQIDHILVDRRRQSNVLDVQSLRAADYDSGHYLVMAKVRERLAVNKQRSHRFRMERFNLRKLKEIESKEKYCIGVSNRFATWEYLDAEVDNNSACGTTSIRDNTKISATNSIIYSELKTHAQNY
jgi:hypothetical protein